MNTYQLPRFLTAYAWVLATAFFVLSLKVPFTFAPPAAELWIVVNFVFESRHILLELLHYFGAIILVFSALAWWALRFTKTVSFRMHFKPIVVFSLYTLSLVWLVLALLIANTAAHPLSGFDWLVPQIFRMAAGGSIAAAMWLLFVFFHAVVVKPKTPLAIAGFLFLALPTIWFSIGAVVAPDEPRVADAAIQRPLQSASAKPNIIVIGIDSFTPLHFKRYKDYIKPVWQVVEPNFIFTDTVATVPRTYPSWASILSGQYSVRSGVRFNLMPRERHNHLDGMLQNRLKAQGYRTAFAMDERLFANFDQSFGFDEVYGPPLGAADLALSGISDHPISNLLGHVPVVGRWLFPHTFSNRAAAKTYWPEEFMQQIETGLSRHDDRPLFLTAHFCVSHWPYYWGERFGVPQFVNGKTGEPAKPKGLNKEPMHAAAVRRAGIQMIELLDFLKAQGYLDNAILVVLSDHGEGINPEEKIKLNPDARFGGPMSDSQFALLLNRTNASFNGHGVNVYDEWQTQVLLSFRGYGKAFEWVKPGATGRPASLVDVAPTVLDMADIPFNPQEFDGISLKPDIQLGGQQQETGERFRIVETDLLIRSMIDINKISVADVVREGIGFYQVAADGRVELKPKVIDEQLQSKIRSVYYRNWILSVSPPLPSVDDPNLKLPSLYILLNRDTGKWTDDMNSELAKSAPLEAMRSELIRHYGKEYPDEAYVQHP